MLTLVSGGVRSGKSKFAENLAQSRKNPQGSLWYFATAQALDHEMHQRILKHQLDRGQAFATLEVPMFKFTDVDRSVSAEDTVLFECLTLYAANVFYSEEARKYGGPNVHQLMGELIKLSQRVDALVIVTNDIFRESTKAYGEETLAYMKFLATLMKELAKEADEVYELYYGLERRLK